MKRLTIGLFNDNFFPVIDGVCMVVDNYAKRLIKYANVIVFVPEYFGNKYDDSKLPYKVVRCKSIKIPFTDYSLAVPKLTSSLYREIKKYKLDIVHIHSPFTMGKYGVIYAKKHKIPVIGTMHSQFEQNFQRVVHSKQLANKLTRGLIKTFNDCDECWAVNSEVSRIFYEEYGYKTMPKVVNNATEMLPVKDIEESKKRINKKYNIKSSEKVFLFVGQINKLKNILFLAESLSIVKKKLKFKMLYVGTGPDEEILKSFIKEKNIEKDVIICGKITDRQLLADLYARADLFLFPSLYDASSIVQIEAASQGTPTVFIEGSATSATITNNVNGFITKDDTTDYANTIIKVMKDKKLYEKVSKNAYNDVYINWDSKIEEVYKMYCKLIANKK
jgi:glycosyltransferase involved in cell wall biosynthesis